MSPIDETKLGVAQLPPVPLSKLAIQLAEDVSVMKLGLQAGDLFVLRHLAKITS